MAIEAARLSVLVESNALKVSGEVKQLGQAVDNAGKQGKPGLEEMEKGLKKTEVSMTKLAATAQGMGVLLGGSAAGALALRVAFDQVMEFGEAGAQLEYAREKFDRLSASIGTTSDALMVDLRTATRGLMSDAELVQSAGDMMSLGLAKTHDEAVRLSTVAGALGMNMNQLVLTLTNQTTMRFDALGVAVDGFDEKLAKLKATGMDTNTAFREAFLQQAEEQMGRVGDQADSNAGAFKRLEAAQKNLSDQTMKDLAPALGFVADALVDVNQATIDSGTSWMRFLPPTLSGVQAAYAGLKAFFDGETGEDRYNKIMAEAAKKQAEANKALAGSTEQLTRQYYQLGQAQRDAFNDLNYDPEKIKKATEDQKGLIQDLQGAYDGLAAAQRNWSQSASSQAAGLLNESALGAEKYKAALGALDEVNGTSLKTQYEQKTALEKANAEYAKTGDLEAYKTKLTEIKEAYMPLDEAVQSSTDLIKKFKDMWDSIQSKYLTLRINYEGGALTPDAGAGGEGSSVGAQERAYNTDLNGNGVIGRATGGPVYRNRLYMTGEEGPEPFIPSVDGRILSVQQAQEAMSDRFNANATRGPVGPVTNIFHKGAIQVSGAGNADEIATKVLEKISRRQRR